MKSFFKSYKKVLLSFMLSALNCFEGYSSNNLNDDVKQIVGGSIEMMQESTKKVSQAITEEALEPVQPVLSQAEVEASELNNQAADNNALSVDGDGVGALSPANKISNYAQGASSSSRKLIPTEDRRGEMRQAYPLPGNQRVARYTEREMVDNRFARGEENSPNFPKYYPAESMVNDDLQAPFSMLHGQYAHPPRQTQQPSAVYSVVRRPTSPSDFNRGDFGYTSVQQTVLSPNPGANVSVVSSPPSEYKKPTNAYNNLSELAPVRRQRVRETLENDYESHLKDLIRSRKFYRKATKYFETTGNCFLYLGSALSAVASGSALLQSSLVNFLTFSSTGSLALHLLLIGMARCSSKESGEAEERLKTMAARADFDVDDVAPTVIDAATMKMARSKK